MKNVIKILIASFFCSCSSSISTGKITLDYFSEYDVNLKFRGNKSYINDGFILSEEVAEIIFYKIEIDIKSKDMFIEGIVQSRGTGEVLPGANVAVGTILNIDSFDRINQSALDAKIKIDSSIVANEKGYFTIRCVYQKGSFISSYCIGYYGLVYKLGKFIKLGN